VDPGPFFYIVITVYHLLTLFKFLQTTIFYHSIRLILCLQQTGEIDNLTISWGKVLGCVVCRFHVAAGTKLHPRQGAIYKLSRAVTKLASINLQKLVLSPTGLINLGFILREDLLLCSLPSSWGSQLGGHLHAIKQFFWRRCRGLKKKKLPGQPCSSNFSGAIAEEKEDFCKESLSLSIFYFVIVLLYLFFLAYFYQKYKKLVPV
jgi:hypothetical protein